MQPILRRPNVFDKRGQWFKGSIHFHTNASDGKLTPEEAMAFFSANHYDFVCFGDHWHVTTPTDPQGKILVIPGCEIDTWTDDGIGNTHIMCVGVHGVKGQFRPENWNTDGRPTQRAMWETAKKISDYQVLAHPYWSTRSPESIKSYEGLRAIEVYNHNFDRSHDMGYAENTWHMLLNEGHQYDATAVDDAHYPQEFGQAWLMVKAEQCTQSAIIESLKAGDFYSTRGPTFTSIEFDGNRLCVKTSPVQRIIFRTTQFFGGVQNAPQGEMLTSADMTIDLNEMEFARIELVDANGRKAWTNPFYFANSTLNPPTSQRSIKVT